jgi:hypothetical protein
MQEEERELRKGSGSFLTGRMMGESSPRWNAPM